MWEINAMPPPAPRTPRWLLSLRRSAPPAARLRRRVSLALAYQQDEARLADLAGQRQDYESERIATLFGLRRTTTDRVDELSLGWAFRAQARRLVGGVESEYDLAPDALISLGSRWRF